MSGHLKGWRVSAGDEHTVFDGNEARLVAVPCGGLSGRTFVEAVEVARLISAAPDLLEALAALDQYQPLEIKECRGDKCRDPWCASCFGFSEAEAGLNAAADDWRKARAAIAKARGAA